MTDDSTGKTETLYQAPFSTENISIETIDGKDYLVVDGEKHILYDDSYDSIDTGIICSPDFDGVDTFMNSNHLHVTGVIRSYQ